MSRLIYLVRHALHDECGRVLSGRSEIQLNAAGRRQAARLADVLASRRPHAVHSSPRRRAQETARAIAVASGVELKTIRALDEIDFGTWKGASFAQLATEPEWTRWNTERAVAAPPNGENMRDAVARLVEHIGGVDLEASEPLILVSHADMIRGTVAYYLGLSFDRILTFDCDPASVSTLCIDHAGGRVVSVNECFA